VLPPTCPRSAGSSFTHSYALDGNMIDTGNTAYNYVQQGSQDSHQNVRFDGTTGKPLCWLDLNGDVDGNGPTGCLELGKYNIPPGPTAAPAGKELTIATWMFQRSIQNNNGARMMVKSEKRDEEYWRLITRINNGVNQLEFGLDFESIGTNRILLLSGTSNPIYVNTWYHVAGVYNGNHMKLYINGVKVSEVSEDRDLLRDDSVRVTMGCQVKPDGHYYTDRYFDGKMAEMIVTSKALTDQDITDLYDQGVPNCDCHKTQSVDVNVNVHQKKGYGGGGGGYYYGGGKAYPSHSSKESVSSTRVKVSDLFSGAF